MGNVLLLLFSTLLICLAALYFNRKWPDIDVIDIYIIFIVLHFGIYPFIRGLHLESGVIFDSYNYNPLAIILVFVQLLLIVIIIKMVSKYFPAKNNNCLKIKTLIGQWASVNNFIIISLYSFLIIFQFISYFKYGVKSHILPSDFDKIGKDLPYWFMSVRTTYNFLTLSVIIVLASKASLSEDRRRYVWLALIIIFLPFVAYFGRKAFVNAAVMGAIIWLVNNEKRLFQLKNLKIATLLVLSFFIASNLYETYRSNLHLVGVSLKKLENPISAALNFKATLNNLKIRPGTWEFSYLVLDRQMKGPGKVTTNGKITEEGFKSAIPRLLWPGKNFQITTEVLADAYNAKIDDVSIGTNIFGVAQAELGYFSIIVVPLTILLIIIIMAGLLKMTANYPVFLWLFSVNFLNFFMYIEENQSEISFMLRNIIILMALFLSYYLVSRMITSLRTKGYTT